MKFPRFITVLGALLGPPNANMFTTNNTLPTTFVVHEERDVVSSSSRWVKLNRVDADAILPMRIGLVQSNLDQAWEYLMEV